jgi:hypothetical protein
MEVVVPVKVIDPIVLFEIATVPELAEPMPKLMAPVVELETATEPVPVPLPTVLPLVVPTLALPDDT